MINTASASAASRKAGQPRQARSSYPTEPGSRASLALKQPQDCLGVRQIFQQRGRLMRAKLLERATTRGDRERACADAFSACDIVLRVADDPHIIGGEIHAVPFQCPAHGVRPEIVAVLAVVREGAEREEIP